MQKSYFHNSKSENKNNDKKISNINPSIDKRVAVDINILLNRVKLEEKNQTKRKIIFFSLTTLAIGLFGTFIVIIK